MNNCGFTMKQIDFTMKNHEKLGVSGGLRKTSVISTMNK
jgi:hypothetical protein